MGADSSVALRDMVSGDLWRGMSLHGFFYNVLVDFFSRVFSAGFGCSPMSGLEVGALCTEPGF